MVAFFQSRTEISPVAMYSGVVTVRQKPFKILWSLGHVPLLTSGLYTMVRYWLREKLRVQTPVKSHCSYKISKHIFSLETKLGLKSYNLLFLFHASFLGGCLNSASEIFWHSINNLSSKLSLDVLVLLPHCTWLV